MKRWIKIPQPGQIRGEGNWMDFDDLTKDWTEMQKEAQWESSQSFLPTHIGEEAPK